MSTVNKALNNLGFNSNDFVLQNNDGVDEIIEWHSKLPQPTQEEIDQAKIDWQAEQNATQYQRDREPEYPPVGDQLDAILKHLNYRRTQGEDLVQDLDDIVGAWLNVKSRYPKNGSN